MAISRLTPASYKDIYVASRSVGETVTGGTEVTFTENSIDYKAHIFKSSGTFDTTAMNQDALNVEILLVGGGGLYRGGAGGYVEGYATVNKDTHAIVIGAGGAPGAATGNDSTAFGITADGGGGGGANGGSGGGGWRGAGIEPAGTATQSDITSFGSYVVKGYGNNGGQGLDNGNANLRTGGGGGGAGAAGTNSTSAGNGGNGGNGRVTTIIPVATATAENVGEVSGTDLYFAGGASGIGLYSNGTGGLGGGASGGWSTNEAGGVNTGGGGAYSGVGTVTPGGSGVVIIRYAV